MNLYLKGVLLLLKINLRFLKKNLKFVMLIHAAVSTTKILKT